MDFGRECEQLIDGYVERVRDHMRHKIGKCGPLSQAYNATTGVVCQQIFRPFVSLFVACLLVGFSLFFSGRRNLDFNRPNLLRNYSISNGSA